MDTTAYLPIAAATGLQRSLDVTAQNLANSTTSGYRGARLVFEELLAPRSSELGGASYTRDALTYSNLAGGSLQATGNPLDVAIQGEGWFGYQTENGQVALGRDGRFVVDAEGAVRTVAGLAVLDLGGAPVQLPLEGGAPSIGADGTISNAQGEVLGQIGLFAGDGVEGWQRIGDTLFVPRGGAAVDLEPAEGGKIVQGALEASNVDPVREMVRMIEIQRSFDQVMGVVKNHDDLRRSSLNRLGDKT